MNNPTLTEAMRAAIDATMTSAAPGIAPTMRQAIARSIMLKITPLIDAELEHARADLALWKEIAGAHYCTKRGAAFCNEGPGPQCHRCPEQRAESRKNSRTVDGPPPTPLILPAKSPSG
jgi:hypothetical protein